MKQSTRDKAGGAHIEASLLEYLHACPICGHVDLRHYCRVPSLFEEHRFIRYERCRQCGTVMRNPRMPAGARLDKYEDKILPPEEKELKPSNQTHYGYMMRWVNRLLPLESGRRLFDFGCGAGGFLVEAQAAGFDVMGLELNRDLATFVEETHGIPVFQGLVSDEGLRGEKFDVVLSSQVFEHLLDPRETLEQLMPLLAKPGILVIEVPSLLDTRERLRRGSRMDDSHFFYFTPSSLSRMLSDQGLRIVKIEQGLRPYRLVPSLATGAPLWALHWGQKLASLAQVRTGLSIIAMLDG